MPYAPAEILLDKYRIEALIGQGAFGEVYRVTHLSLNVPRALKVLRRDAPGIGSTEYNDCLARFQFEAQLGAQLNTPTPHPNLLQIHDFDRSGDLLVLEMEYAPSGSLAERIQRSREKGELIPVPEALSMALDVTAGLAILHARDIVHRDLKPNNILFDNKNRAKVADLGLAQVPGGPSLRSQLSQPLPHPGTPAYMSPEQRDTRDYLPPASDVFSLGVVLFEALTGRVYRSQRPGTSPSSLRAEIPSWLNDLLVRMLSEDPKDRPWNGGEAASLLQEGLEGDKAKRKAEVAQQAAEEKARLEAHTRQEREADDRRLLELAKFARREAEIKARQTAVDQSRREAQEREQRVAEQRLAEIARLQSDIEDALGRKEWGKAKRSISQLKNLGPEGQAMADVLRNHLPKPGVPGWVWAVVGLGVIGIIFVLLLQGSGAHDTQTPATFVPTGLPPTEVPAPGIGSTWIRPADGMLMVYVPQGDFSMGSDSGESNEKPVHTVSLDAFWIDQTEVTNGMYAKCVSSRACQPPSSNASYTHTSYYGNPQFADYPVVYVDWNHAKSYCAWAAARLPTEAEWEMAARGTEERTYPWGNSPPTCNLANYSGCVGDTTAVGSYPAGASPYGALDMAGNVWEWVNDWYGETYYSQSPSSNPQGPASGDHRVLRGGAWFSSENGVRSANRCGLDPVLTYDLVGFRCARSLP